MKINADPDFLILFEDGNDVSDPIWMLLFSNKAALDKLVNLGLNRSMMLG